MTLIMTFLFNYDFSFNYMIDILYDMKERGF